MSFVIDLGHVGQDGPVVTLGWGGPEGYLSWRPAAEGPGELLHADRRITVGIGLLVAMARPGGFEDWTFSLVDDREDDPAKMTWVARFPFRGETVVYRPTGEVHRDGQVVLEWPD